MKHILLFSFFALFVPILSFAQTATITGQVKDSTSNERIELASVSLINQKGKVEGIATTDKTGRFEISINTIGDYTVVVEFVGYKKKSIPNVSI